MRDLCAGVFEQTFRLIQRIYTFDRKDFGRFTELELLTPRWLRSDSGLSQDAHPARQKRKEHTAKRPCPYTRSRLAENGGERPTTPRTHHDQSVDPKHIRRPEVVHHTPSRRRRVRLWLTGRTAASMRVWSAAQEGCNVRLG